MKMKSLVAALALGFISVGANAAITNSQAGNGELFITLYDAGGAGNTDDRAYVRDLGSLLGGGTMNDWVSATTTAAGLATPLNNQGFGTIFSVAADANLASFLSGTTDLSRLRWNIAAVDSNGTDRLLTTGNAVSPMTYTQFRSVASFTDTYLAAINPALLSADSATYSGAAAVLNLWGDNLGGSLIGSTNAAGLGGSLGFFAMSERATTGTTTLTDVRQFMADATTRMEWSLAANGTLSYGATAVTAPIPEPETYGMLLAGLGMIGFMARRRLNNRV